MKLLGMTVGMIIVCGGIYMSFMMADDLLGDRAWLRVTVIDVKPPSNYASQEGKYYVLKDSPSHITVNTVETGETLKQTDYYSGDCVVGQVGVARVKMGAFTHHILGEPWLIDCNWKPIQER